jgi:uncharacterized protein
MHFYLILLLIIIGTSLRGLGQTADLDAEIMEFRRKYFTTYINSEKPCYVADDTIYLDFFPPSANFKINAKYTQEHTPEELTIPTYSGSEKSFVRTGKISFFFQGNEYTLSTFQQASQMRHPVNRYQLFVPFKDETTGTETYGGGRYLDISLAGIPPGGEFKLDFNKAYNPLCAYTEGFNCPIPPPENQLAMKVQAGEKQYKKSID